MLVDIGHVNEESTIVFDCSFFDEDDVVMTPTEVKWSLSETDGTIINNRKDVVLTAPFHLVLTGADTAMQAGIDSGERRLTFRCLYTSTYGTGLHLNKEYALWVDRLVNVPAPV